MYLRVMCISIFSFCIIFQLCACSEDGDINNSNGNTDGSKIITLFLDLETACNTKDWNLAQNCFSQSYRHQGNSELLDVPMLVAIGDPYQVELANITPVVNGETATCSFHSILIGYFVNDTLYVEEDHPDDQDLGVHILRKESDGWKIYGDQQ